MGEAKQSMVLVSTDELAEIVNRAVRDAINTNAASVSDYLTLDQCAEWMQVHPRTIKRWIDEEGFPALRVGMEYRFHRPAIIAWLNGRSVRPGQRALKKVK